MPHIEITTIEKKIEETKNEIQNLSEITDDSLRSLMSLEMETRLGELEKQKQELLVAAAKETVSLRIYGEKVQTGKISSRILLSALGGFQAMLDSVANAMLHSPTSRGKIPGHIKDITGFEVVGTFAGSFGIVLEQQKPQYGLMSGDSELSRVMNEMFGVLETLDDSTRLISAISPCGKRTVSHYRQWLDEMRESGVNLEINWKNDSVEVRELHLTAERAPSIITTLDTIDKIDNETLKMHGILNGINIRSHSFELGVDGVGIVRGTALPETLMSVAEKIGTEIDAVVVKSKSYTKAGIQTVSWYMSNILE